MKLNLSIAEGVIKNSCCASGKLELCPLLRRNSGSDDQET
jgi:hypothetical protein